MKKIAFLLMLSSITFPVASQNILDSFYLKKLKSEYFPYSDGVEYKLEAVSHSGISNLPVIGNNYTYYKAPGDKKYKTVIFKFKNNAEEDQIIDFSNFFLIDKRGETHKAWSILVAGRIYPNGDMHDIKLKFKAGKTKTIMVQFYPEFPEDELPYQLIVNDRVLTLEQYLRSKS